MNSLGFIEILFQPASFADLLAVRRQRQRTRRRIISIREPESQQAIDPFFYKEDNDFSRQPLGFYGF